MKALVDAVADSIQADGDVKDNRWTYEKTDPLWRNPFKGKVLNVYPGTVSPAPARWTGSTIDIVQIVVEYGEPAGSQSSKLQRDEGAELGAHDVADSIRDWALKHEGGFAPAHKMDVIRVEYTPQVRRELFSRYLRVTLAFEVVKAYV